MFDRYKNGAKYYKNGPTILNQAPCPAPGVAIGWESPIRSIRLTPVFINFGLQHKGMNSPFKSIPFPLTLALLAGFACLLPACLLPLRADSEGTDSSSQDFTIAVLPDTQFYCDTRLKLSAKWGNGDLRRYFFAQTEWVRDNQERLNIAFLAHEGDLVQADAPEEWAIAKEAMSLLDGKVPYIMCLGNHDMGFEKADNKYGGNIGVNRDTHFNTYFPREKFAKRREFGGTFDPERHDNSWYHFEAAGMKFLIISLECKPRDEVLEWANQVVSEHPDHRVLVLTHAYLKPNKSRDTSGGVKAKGNTGEQTWQKFVSKHKNIFMVLCGHHSGEAVLTSTGDHGNGVHQVLCDYQNMNNGGESWLRYMTFKPENDTISVHTYNPALDQYNEGPKSRFDLHYPMEPSQASLKSSSKN